MIEATHAGATVESAMQAMVLKKRAKLLGVDRAAKHRGEHFGRAEKVDVLADETGIDGGI